jgi:hypothetical protein
MLMVNFVQLRECSPLSQLQFEPPVTFPVPAFVCLWGKQRVSGSRGRSARTDGAVAVIEVGQNQRMPGDASLQIWA